LVFNAESNGLKIKMKILVTGGSGFLGINLIRYLLSRGIEDILALDIADFNYSEKAKIKFIKGDIRNKDLIARVIDDVDVIVHAAAALPLYKKEEIYSTEVEGTNNLLEAASEKSIPRFIYISSTAVYGIPAHHPLVENDQLMGVGDYGKAKIIAERICQSYRTKGMCISIIRPKSCVGPERLGIFALFYEWAKDGKNFPIIGSGSNRYQLLDVEDLSELIFLCATKEKQVVNDVFNVGAKEFTNLKEDFQVILDKAGYGKKIITLPVLPVTVTLRILERLRLSPVYKWIYQTVYRDSFVSIARAEQKLDFSPKYSNKDALLRNYKWYLENLNTFGKKTGISHRLPWKKGVLKLAKVFF